MVPNAGNKILTLCILIGLSWAASAQSAFTIREECEEILRAQGYSAAELEEKLRAMGYPPKESPSRKKGISVYKNGQPASSDESSRLAKVITGMMEEVKPLETPLSISIFTDSSNFAMHGTSIISMASSEWGKHLGIASAWEKPALTHEFGHAIFSLNLANLLPEWKEVYKVYERFDELFARKLETDDLLRAQEKVNVSENAFAAQIQINNMRLYASDALGAHVALEASLAQALEALPEASKKLILLIRPYNELFADLASAIYLKDGSVSARAMGIHLAQFRDFSIERSVEGFDEIVRDRALGFHELLAPTRSFIGREYLQKEPHPLLLQSVLRATASELRLQLHEKTTPSPELMNQRIIKAIKREMQKVKRTP